MNKGISYIVTCEEHIKSLQRAKNNIYSAYTLGENPYNHIENRILNDIDNLILLYQIEIEENK